MRMRVIKPGFFYTDASPLARIMFAGLWCLADREGRLADRPRRIRGEVLPYDADANADALLDELAAGGYIVRYEVDGQRYIEIPAFLGHQRPSSREVASTIPPNPVRAQAEPRSIPSTNQDLPEHDLDEPPARAWDHEQDQKGNKTSVSTTSNDVAPADAEIASPEAIDAATTSLTRAIFRPATAQAIVGWFCDAAGEIGLTVTASTKGRVGKQAKALFDAGAVEAGVRWAVAEAARRNQIALIETLYGDWEREHLGIDRSPPPAPRHRPGDQAWHDEMVAMLKQQGIGQEATA